MDSRLRGNDDTVEVNDDTSKSVIHVIHERRDPKKSPPSGGLFDRSRVLVIEAEFSLYA
jgi:hypothetical protein